MAKFDAILDYVAQHVTLTEEEEALFIEKLQPKRLLKNQYLLQADQVCRYESFVTKGCLRTFFLDDEGKEHIVQFAIENWWVADLQSFFEQQPAHYHIQALENSELLMLDFHDVEKLYQEVPKFERFFRIILQKAYAASQKRSISIISKTAAERYEEFTTQYHLIEQRVPQYMVASYLGFTPEFLSKIRAKASKSKKS
jgi:CRP-like cAMP-binding protein